MPLNRRTILTLLLFLLFGVGGIYFFALSPAVVGVKVTPKAPASKSQAVVEAGPGTSAKVASSVPPAQAASAGAVAVRPVLPRVPTASDARPIHGRAPFSMPVTQEFLDKIGSTKGQAAKFSLPDGRQAVGTIELLRSDENGTLLVQGPLSSPEAGYFSFKRLTFPGVAGPMAGEVRFHRSDMAFRVDPPEKDGPPMLVEHSIHDVICVNMHRPRLAAAVPDAENPMQAPQNHPVNISIPSYQNGIVPLQSLPGAQAVIYLDFDGETGPFDGWGSFNASSSNASTAEVLEVWQRVAEDYLPFNINVTTDRRVFDSAPVSSRQQCIITPTRTAAPGSGGVSYVGSFDSDRVNWAFWSHGTSPKDACEIISHECGHALGLRHDGRTSPAEEYYGGHGSGVTGWAPIMGVGYYQTLSQWSKGEYLNANNHEDDTAIIANNNNNVGFRADDFGATFSTGGYLEVLADNSVSNEGIIATADDVDAFRFTTTGGAVSFNVAMSSKGPDLDILAEIYTSADVLVASNNPGSTLDTSVSATLAAGDYTLRVSGAGKGDPLGTGYTDYGSLGTYLISGTAAGVVKPDRFTVAENSANNTAVGTVQSRLDHAGNPVTYAITSGNTGGAFAIDASTGDITVANSSLLNYEVLSTQWDDPASYQLFVAITDPANTSLNESIRVVVTVSDINEPPSVTGGSATILEHSPVGTKVFLPVATDPDRFEFPTFSIVSGNTGGVFAIDGSSGQITVATDITASVQSVYTLTVRVTDHGAPALTSEATVTVNITPVPPGYILGTVRTAYWEGIGGNNISTLTSYVNYPNNPNSLQTLTSFDFDVHGDSYGSTTRGYLIPAVTGSYTFWIATDDDGELYLSTNESPANATLRASVSGSTARYDWTRFSSQQSAPVTLTAGVPYYIEVRQKEGGGDDWMAVAWQGPGIVRQVIPGANLAPFYQNYAPRFSAASYSFSLPGVPANGTVAGTVVATDLNVDTLTYSILSGNPAGNPLAINPSTGAITVADNAALPSGQAVNLQVRVQDTGNGGQGAALNSTVNVTITVGALITLTSPTANNVSIPSGVGISLAANVGGRTNTTIAWSKVSGPGTVTFDTPAVVTTGAKFSANGTYVLRCSETSGASTTSVDVTVNVGPLGLTLTGTKVGTQAVNPSHTVNAGTYTITTVGTGIPSSSQPDDFYFLNIPVTGDVTAQARIVSEALVNGTRSRCGVMIRDGFGATALHAFCAITAENGQRFIYRATAGANNDNFPISPATSPFVVYWVKLVRAGTSFTAFVAPDNAGTPGAFTALGGAQTIAIPNNAYVGLAVTSGNGTTPGVYVIDNFTLTPNPANLGPTVSAGNAATVTLPATASLDGTVTDDGKPAAFTTQWSKFSGPGTVTFGSTAAIDTSATFATAGSYILRLTANDTEVQTFADVALTVQLTPMAQWKVDKFGANVSDPLIIGDLADPDKDGLLNLIEYSLDLNPTTPNGTGILSDLETIGQDQFLRLTINKNPLATDIIYSVQVSDNLSSWNTAGTQVEINTSTQLRVRSTTPMSNSAHQNLRLQVTHP